MTPILSICIPTYNRNEILDKSLQSLVKQDVFQQTNDVEIVISDNTSTDNTHEIAEKYIALYGNKIRYFKNEQNVEEKNFPLALSRGRGLYRKICNDTLIFAPNSLQMMLDAINNSLNEKPVLFFINNDKDNRYCDTMNDFVLNASFMTTWIGGFGLWQEDLYYLDYMDKFSHTRLPQTAVLLKMMSDKKKALIIGAHYCNLARPSLSGGYNLSEVFIKNYLDLYKPYLDTGELSKEVYERERWLVLRKHVLPRQFNVKHKFEYDKSDFWKYTKEYHKSSKFYWFILRAFIKKICHLNYLYLHSKHE